jgi:hypothetical protein
MWAKVVNNAPQEQEQKVEVTIVVNKEQKLEIELTTREIRSLFMSWEGCRYLKASKEMI